MKFACEYHCEWMQALKEMNVKSLAQLEAQGQ